MLINVEDKSEQAQCDECKQFTEEYETTYEILVGGKIITLCETCYIDLLEIIQYNLWY